MIVPNTSLFVHWKLYFPLWKILQIIYNRHLKTKKTVFHFSFKGFCISLYFYEVFFKFFKTFKIITILPKLLLLIINKRGGFNEGVEVEFNKGWTWV